MRYKQADQRDSDHHGDERHRARACRPTATQLAQLRAHLLHIAAHAREPLLERHGAGPGLFAPLLFALASRVLELLFELREAVVERLSVVAVAHRRDGTVSR